MGKINKSGVSQKDQVVFLGIDLGKKSFQLHGVDAKAHVALKKKLNRKELLPFMANLPQCVIGIEAWKTGVIYGPPRIARKSLPS